MHVQRPAGVERQLAVAEHTTSYSVVVCLEVSGVFISKHRNLFFNGPVSAKVVISVFIEGNSQSPAGVLISYGKITLC
jgi:hypothetical protein